MAIVEGIEMVTEATKWMAEKISSLITGEARKKFLQAMQKNPDYVITLFALDVESLAMNYAFETGQPVVFSSSEGDSDVFDAQARRIFEYMRDEMLKDELVAI